MTVPLKYDYPKEPFFVMNVLNIIQDYWLIIGNGKLKIIG